MTDDLLEAADLEGASDTLHEVAVCVNSVAASWYEQGTDPDEMAEGIAKSLGPEDSVQAWEFMQLDDRLLDRMPRAHPVSLIEAAEQVAHDTLRRMAKAALLRLEAKDMVAYA